MSNARLDFPLPDKPVITVSLSRGMLRDMFFKLCSRAPRITILFSFIAVFYFLPVRSHASAEAWRISALAGCSFLFDWLRRGDGGRVALETFYLVSQLGGDFKFQLGSGLFHLLCEESYALGV